MKRLCALSSFVALAACMSPSSAPLPAGAVSFAQVLADNAATPFECSDYDPTSRSCASVGRYIQQADGSLLSEGFFLLQDSPRVVARGVATVRAINGRSCTQAGELQFELIEGASDPRAQFMLGFMESIFAESGEVCSTYTPNGTDYRVMTEAQAGPLQGPIASTSRFFATQPSLRSEF